MANEGIEGRPRRGGVTARPSRPCGANFMIERVRHSTFRERALYGLPDFQNASKSRPIAAKSGGSFTILDTSESIGRQNKISSENVPELTSTGDTRSFTLYYHPPGTPRSSWNQTRGGDYQFCSRSRSVLPRVEVTLHVWWTPTMAALGWRPPSFSVPNYRQEWEFPEDPIDHDELGRERGRGGRLSPWLPPARVSQMTPSLVRAAQE